MNDVKVGELFVLGFRGNQLPPWLRDFSRRYGLGGVILFDYDVTTKTYQNNIVSKDQTRSLCAQIHALESRPFVCIDQEGGKVRRLKESLGFAPLPSQWAMSQLSVSQKRAILEKSYAELREVGVDLCLAPVVDLNTNPSNPDIGAVERSYSADASKVREHALLVDEVARQFQLGLCLKHYPGLGGAKVNSHFSLTDLSGTIDESQLELFWELGRRIHGHSILVSHGIVNEWEAEVPLTLSRVALGRLREKLPEAILISDDMQMQGLQKLHRSAKACELGIEVGLDLVLFGNNLLDEQDQVHHWAEAIRARVSHDSQFKSGVLASLERVRRLKLAIIR